MTQEQRLARLASRPATDARLDRHDALAAKSSFARHESGALGTNRARQAIDERAGFDREGKDDADMARGRSPIGLALFLRRARLFGLLLRCLFRRRAHLLPRRAEQPVS